MAIEAKYEFCGSWQEMPAETFEGAARMLADQECQASEPAIVLTRCSEKPHCVYRHEVWSEVVTHVKTLRGDV